MDLKKLIVILLSALVVGSLFAGCQQDQTGKCTSNGQDTGCSGSGDGRKTPVSSKANDLEPLFINSNGVEVV